MTGLSTARRQRVAERALPFHQETTVVVKASAEEAFAHLDDPLALSAHMGKPSMMMMGSRMSTELDAGAGRAVGSRIRMHGRVMGIPISLEEVVGERRPPLRKSWETIGEPRLVVIGHYRMGFEVVPEGASSRVTVFIDFELPATAPQSWLGRLFGGAYARWCIEKMATDTATHFC